MKLDKNTLTVLGNFANIQPNLLVEAGYKVSTIAEARNIVAEAELTQEFPSRFIIYDLKEFLSTISLLDDPDLKFKDDHVLIEGSGGISKVKYFFASEEVITTPPQKGINFPGSEVELTVEKTILEKLLRASSVLGHEMLLIENSEGSNVTLSVADPKDSTANRFTIEAPAKYESGAKFSFIISIKNLKMIPGTYKLSLSSKKIGKFEKEDSALLYYISMDKTSTYGE